MNQRIKELLLKAGFTNAYTDPKEGFELVFVDEEHTTESAAKFAELIVRQCGYYADVFEAMGCPVDMDPTETKPSDYIKQHFGVEL